MADAARPRENDPIPAVGWELIHVVATGVLATLALAISFRVADAGVSGALLLYGVLAWGGLLLARAARTFLLDLFAQFHYREKFALFLAHGVVMLVPWTLGFRGWNHAFAAVLALLCLQAVHALGFGRVYAMTVLMVLAHLPGREATPFALAGAWMLALLACVRVEHIRFTLERHPSSRGLPLRDALAGSFLPIVLSSGLGLVVWLASASLFRGQRRPLVLEVGVLRGAGDIGPVGGGGYLFDAVLLVGMIIGALVVLQWIERKFRRRRASPGQEETLGVTELRHDRTVPTEMAPQFDEEGDARGRILRRFRQLGHALARRDDETPREFLGRLTTAGDPLPGFVPALLDRAAYSRLPVDDAQAAELLARLDAWETQVREETEPARGSL
jgi:hypothetical protein